MLHTIRNVRYIGAAVGARVLCKCGQSNVARTRYGPAGVYAARVE